MASNTQLELALRIKAMTDDARKELNRFVDELERTDKEGKNAAKGVKDTGSAVDQLGNTSREAARDIKRTSDALDKMDASSRKGHAPLQQTNKNLHLVGLSAGEAHNAMRMLPAQITDIVTGLVSGQPAYMVAIQQGGQLKDTFGGVGNAARGLGSVLKKAFSPARLAIGGLVAVAATLSVALIKGYLEAQHLNETLIATGNYAGRTSAQLAELSIHLGKTQGDYGDAAQAVMLLVGSGKIASQTLDDAARGAVAFAQVTRQSISDAVAAIVKIQKDPVTAVAALNKQYHFLTAAQYAQIQALQDEGDAAQAAAVAQKTFADAMDDRRKRDVKNLGDIQRAWRQLKNEISGVWTVMKNAGNADIGAQIRALQARKRNTSVFTNTLAAVPFVGDKLIANRNKDIDAQIAALKKQAKAQQKVADAKAKTQKVQDAGVTALAKIKTWTEAAATAATRYADHITDINKQFDAAIKATPKMAAALDAQRGVVLRKLASDYAKSLSPHKPPKPPVGPSAVTLTKAAAAANQQLRDTFIQLQAAQDPVAAAAARYNAVMARATAAADKAKLATGANVAAIDGYVAGIEHMAAATRDAALDAIADKDRLAWEKLQKSLRTPVEVNVANAIAKLKALQKLFDSGKSGMTHAQLLTSAAKIGTQSAKQAAGAAPHYAGITNNVGFLGNVGSQINQNLQAQKDLDTWHQAQLAADAKFNAQSEAQKVAHTAYMAGVDKQYNDEKKRIDQARGTLALQTASGIFGQLAQLSSSHNKKMATIGKAAAIAQAIINTYQSATAAYASLAGIPYVGPALGIAAAAAAIAAGLANVAQIRSQPVGGYATGGAIRGPGTGTSDSIPIMASHGEYMQSAAAVQYYGVNFMDALNGRQMPRFASGGLISGPADFAGVAPPNVSMPAIPTMPAPEAGGQQRGGKTSVRIINSVDPSFVTDNMASSEGEEVIINTIAHNQARIKQMIG